MKRDEPNPPVLIDIGPRTGDIDPWSEFLPEAGEDPRPAETPPVSPADAFLSEEPGTGEDAGISPLDTTGTRYDADPDAHPAAEAPVADPPGAQARPDMRWSRAAALPDTDAEAEAQPPRVVRFSPAPFAARDPDAHAQDGPLSVYDREPDGGQTGHAQPPERVGHRTMAMTAAAPAAAAVARAEVPAPAPVRDASLSLADVIARRVMVRPAEAVAAVQELCVVLTDPAHPVALVPDPRDVLIAPSGLVSIRQGAKGDRDARALSRMLHTLLGTSTPPLPLRLFVTSAITSERYRSVALFAEALSHYGSQNRGELLRGLYRRTREMPVPADASEKAREVLSRHAARRTKRAGRAWIAAAGALLVAGAAGAGAWRWQQSRAAAVATDAPAAGRDEGPAPVRRASVIRDNWQLGPVTIPEEPPPPPPAPPVRPRPAARTVPSPVSAPAPVPAPVLPSAPPEPTPAALPAAAAAPVEVPAGPPPLDSRRPAAPVTGQRTGLQVDPRIYSREHLDVQPPVLLPAQQLSMSPTLSEEVKHSLELLIDEKGVVQRARFLNRPQRFSDMSILSQAKMLKFRPAVRNGAPVKYLLHMNSLETRD